MLVIVGLVFLGPAVSAAQTDGAADAGVDDQQRAATAPDSPADALPGYQQTLKRAMDLLFTLLESIESRRDLTLDQKQKRAIDFIRHLRWGPNNRNYFWINDLDGIMVLEPIHPAAEGRDVLHYTDLNNKRLFRQFIDTSLADGEGFVDHHGLGYDQNKSNPQISLVRLFRAWRWVVGTGLETERIEAYEEPEGLLFNIPLPPITDELPASGI